MSNYPFIISPIQLELGEKEKIMSTNETPKEKPTVSIGDLSIELEINKPSDRYIITKKYQGSKLFYKMYRKVCSSYLSKGTHFETYDKAKEHFDSFIKSNWKHTKQFQIEPVSNFFISDWSLVVPDSGYYGSQDLANKKKVILKNVPVSIDNYKRGAKKLTTVKELLDKFIAETDKRKIDNERAISDYERQITQIQMNISNTKASIESRAKNLEELLKSDSIIQDLIEQNTTEAERTVKLIYGQD